MRPLNLIISAFGPYANRVEIPFQELGTNGIYLITGNTGAGKTTIFDAITYALYGEPSGDARDASMLRSKYAAPETLTEVELVFSCTGKEYTIHRNPGYYRPAKRGEGTVFQRPDAHLILPDKQVVTKPREVQAAITEMMGLDREQFTQIAMLAQGDFLKFLLADTASRQEIFRKLFKTQRYQSFQEEVGAQTRELEADYRNVVSEIQQSLGGLLASEDFPQLEPARARELPISEIQNCLEEMLSQDRETFAYQTQTLKQLDEALARCNMDLGTAQETEKNRLELQEIQREYQAQLPKFEAARKSWEAERDRQPERDALNAALTACQKELPRYRELDERAAVVSQLQESIVRQQERLARREDTCQEETQRRDALRKEAQELAHIGEEKERLLWECADLQTRQTALQALAADVDDWKDHCRQIEKIQGVRQDLRHQMENAGQQLSQQKEQLQREREALQATEKLDAEREKLCHSQEQAQGKRQELGECANALAHCQDLRRAAELAQGEYQEAAKAADEMAQCFRRKNRAFLDEQAGILAQELEEGKPCPVCGALRHPAPATAHPDAPSEAELEAWKQRSEMAQKREQEASLRAGRMTAAVEERERQLLLQLRPYEDNIEISQAASILAARHTENEACLAQLRQALSDLEAQLKSREGLQQKFSAREEQVKQLLDRQEGLALQLQKTERQYSGVQGRKETLEVRLLEQLQLHLEGCPLEEASGRLQTEMEATKAALSRRKQQGDILNQKLARKIELERLLPQQEQRLTSCVNSLSELRAELAGTMSRKEEAEGQFAGMKKDLSSLDERTARERLRELKLQKKTVGAAWERVQVEWDACKTERAKLEESMRRLTERLAASNPMDVEALQTRRKSLIIQRQEVVQKQQEVHTRLTANASVLERVVEQGKVLTSLEEQRVWMNMLSNTVNGRLNGMTHIALETYVQRTYFERILRRSNLHFMTMSDGQYEFRRQEQAQNNRSQSGLELDVLDHYNGSRRSVRSLSGGESFMAALSLALGLSDEIQSNAGGIQLESMFVDEGFGSLDEEALQQAIRTLNRLAQGSRLIGIISHVAELKACIDKQMVITKEGSRGSRVKLVIP